MSVERRGLAAHHCRSQPGRQGRDDKGAHPSAGPETKTIRQGEGRTVWTSQMSRLQVEAVEQGMAVWHAGTLLGVPRVVFTVDLGSRSSLIGPITLDVKCAGARSAGNPLATCDVAGAGNHFTARIVRHSQRKRRVTDRPSLRSSGASPYSRSKRNYG